MRWEGGRASEGGWEGILGRVEGRFREVGERFIINLHVESEVGFFLL